MNIALNKNIIIAVCLLLLYLIMALVFLNGFFTWHYNWFIALALIPFLFSKENNKPSYRHIIPTVIFGLLSFLVTSKTLLFLAILFGVILIIENIIGRLNNLILFAFIIVSPVFSYLSNALGFPIRLVLSEWAVNILNSFGENYVSNGNLITQNQYEFSIDQACAGLNMLATSLLICLFFVAYHLKNLKIRASLFKFLVLILFTISLNIISNLLRIILLVKWNIMPNNVMHDVIGILCLLFYVIIPLYFISRWFLKYKSSAINGDYKPLILKIKYPIIHLSLIGIIAFSGFQSNQKQKTLLTEQKFDFADYKHQSLNNGVFKLEDKESLIYLKPTPFYAPEHNPMICWIGSGYDFKLIKKETFKGKEIYTGLLVKGNDKIHTAWWFESKNLQTVNQISWRWKALVYNEDFYLINVNASTNRQLNQKIRNLLNQSFLKI